MIRGRKTSGRIWLSIALVLGAVTGLVVSAESSRADAWREDLAFLHQELKRRHPDPFHHMPEEEFGAALEALGRRVHGLTLEHFTVELQKILASLREGHTGISGWVWAFPRAPVKFSLLSDGLFITAVAEKHRELLGSKVVRFGSVPVDEGLARLTSTISADNDHWARALLPMVARMPKLLHALEAGGTRECLSLQVEGPDRSPGSAEICAGGDEVRMVDLIADGRSLPVSMQDHGERIYWDAMVPDSKAFYVRYDSCREDSALPFARFTEDVMRKIDEKEIERFILDLRKNSGGNSAVARPLIEALSAHPRLSRPGAIHVLVGPMTVSSAFMNAMQLKENAGALLVGETMGQRPNSFGEIKTFELSGSGLEIQHSTKFHRMIPDADPEVIHPDIEVTRSSADLLQGRDPVLEAALAYEAP